MRSNRNLYINGTSFLFVVVIVGVVEYPIIKQLKSEGLSNLRMIATLIIGIKYI